MSSTSFYGNSVGEIAPCPPQRCQIFNEPGKNQVSLHVLGCFVYFFCFFVISRKATERYDGQTRPETLTGRMTESMKGTILLTLRASGAQSYWGYAKLEIGK